MRPIIAREVKAIAEVDKNTRQATNYLKDRKPKSQKPHAFHNRPSKRPITLAKI
jgi:hypothetical protein